METFRYEPRVTRRIALGIDQVRYQTTSSQGLAMLGDVAASCETVLRTARWTRWGNVTNGAIRGVTQRGWLRSTRIEICFTPWSAGISELSVCYDLPWPATVQLRQHDYDRLHNLADALVAGLQLGTLDSSESLGWSDADDIDMRELVSA